VLAVLGGGMVADRPPRRGVMVGAHRPTRSVLGKSRDAGTASSAALVGSGT
jgi:hypothetical protein